MIFRAPIAAVSLRRSRKINYAFFNFFYSGTGGVVVCAEAEAVRVCV